MGAKIREGGGDGQEAHGRAQATVVVVTPEPVPAPPDTAGEPPPPFSDEHVGRLFQGEVKTEL